MQKNANELVLIGLFRALSPAAQRAVLNHVDGLIARQHLSTDLLDAQRRDLDANAAILAKRDKKFRAFLARLTA